MEETITGGGPGRRAALTAPNGVDEEVMPPCTGGSELVRNVGTRTELGETGRGAKSSVSVVLPRASCSADELGSISDFVSSSTGASLCGEFMVAGMGF
jgi:hypothetical protein